MLEKMAEVMDSAEARSDRAKQKLLQQSWGSRRCHRHGSWKLDIKHWTGV
jgi:hypothetical protein